jgi:DNA-binding CsgD family transcriptional regulator/PAS domain-containing protein
MPLAEFESLIATIYDAVGRPETWNEVLADIGRRMNAERMVFYIRDLKANRLLFSASHNIDPAVLAIFEKKYLNSPITTPSMLTSVGAVGTSRELVLGRAESEQSEIYRELLAPLNIYYRSGALVLREENAVGAFAAMRSREPGPFTEDEDDVLIRLTPHLSRAAQLHYRFRAAELERSAAVEALDRLAHAVVISDGNARIVMANASAKALLDSKRGLRSVGGQLAGNIAAQSDQIVAAIRAAANRERDSASVLLDNEHETFRVLISRLSPRLRLGFAEQTDLVLVTFSDPAAEFAASAELLGEMLKLTDAEARVALGLAHGKTMEAIANEFGVSLNTIRTHVAAAFAKTQTNRQSDLVRLVLRTIGPFGLG